VASLLASAESMTIGVRTLGGRTLEYRTSLIAERENSFSIYVAADLWDRLEPGQAVQIKASLPTGFLLFETRVLAMDAEPIAHADLETTDPGNVRRNPRRQYFRVPAVLPLTFTFERPGAKIPEQIVTLTATTFDISTGGVGIVVDRSREVVLPAASTNGRVALTLAQVDRLARVASPTVITCEGRIARLEEHASSVHVRLGVDFRNMSEPQTMEVSRFVIAHQLELRRRGVLV